MRFSKPILLVAAALLGLVVVAAVLVILLFDPNDFRDDIERIVTAQTGRTLELDGDLSLSIFPWLGIETGPARVGDAPGFGPEPFLSVDELHVAVRLLPLIRGRIELGEIRLERPRLELVTDANGRHNWDDLLSRPGERSADTPSIAGLIVRDGRVRIEDQTAGTSLAIHSLDLTVGRFEVGRTVDVEASMQLAQAQSLANVGFEGALTLQLEPLAIVVADPRIEATVRSPSLGVQDTAIELRAQRFEGTATRYVLESLAIEATLGLDGLPRSGVPADLDATQLDADLDTGRASIAGLVLDLAGARLTSAKLDATQILDMPRVEGSIVVPEMSLRDWLPQLGIELPATRASDALEQFQMQARLEATRQQVHLVDVSLSVDATRASGWVTVTDYTKPGLQFDLDVDRVDLGRYLPPHTGTSSDVANADVRAVTIDALREIDVAGTLTVGAVVLDDVTLEGLHAVVTAADGAVRIERDDGATRVARAQLSDSGGPSGP